MDVTFSAVRVMGLYAATASKLLHSPDTGVRHLYKWTMGPDGDQHNELSGMVDGDVAMVRNVHGDLVLGGRPAQQLVPRQLPAAPWHFTGRHVQLTGLTTLADQSSAAIVVAHAAAGIGKTALVVHWAHGQTERFQDGQLYVNLRGSDATGWPRRPAEVIRDILVALGVEVLPQGEDRQLSLYRTLLAGKRVLLVLDAAHSAEQVRRLLLPGPHSLVIITSRNPLADLVSDGARWLPIDVLDHEESGELLTRQLGTERAAAEPTAIVELAELCAGLPGALGTASSLAGTASLADLTAELRHYLADSTNDAVTRAQVVLSWAQHRDQLRYGTPALPRLISNAEWLLDRRVLGGLAVALGAAAVAVSTSFFAAAGFLGVGYFVLRFAMLGTGVVLMERDGPARPLGAGAVTGSTVYFLVDALVSIHSTARVEVWLELTAVLAFTTLLMLRWQPLRYQPRRLSLVPPSSRPLSFAVLAAVLTWFILLFVGIPVGEYGTTTMISSAGALGALFPLLVIGGLCVLVALTEAADESQRLFVSATIVCYLLPELLLLLGSLVLGQQFAYFGNAVFLTDSTVTWLTVMQAVVVAAMIVGTLTILRMLRPHLRP